VFLNDTNHTKKWSSLHFHDKNPDENHAAKKLAENGKKRLWESLFFQ